MNTTRSRSSRRYHLGDEGQAVVEGVLSVIALLIILVACFFLFTWGNNLQHAHMGSRVLAFRAAKPEVAWPRNPSGATTSDNKADPSGWSDPGTNWNGSNDLLGTMLGWLNGEQSGTVTDRVTGKVFILDPGRTALGYNVRYVTASNPWRIERGIVDAAFLVTAWLVGFSGKSLKDMGVGEKQPDIDPENPAVILTKNAVKQP